MKALLLTNEYPPHVYGGAGVHVEYLSRELAKLCPVDVRCFGEQRQQSKNLSVKGYGAPSYEVTAPKPQAKVFDAVQRCLHFNTDRIDADLVHVHTWYTHFGGLLAKLNYSIPLVLTVHSLEPLRPWKREQLAGGYDFSCWIEKTAIESADAVIAVSEQTKSDILHFFDVDPNKIHIIYNGIDPEEYRPAKNPAVLKKYGIDSGKPYVLFVGRVTRQKGIFHLLDAVEHLNPDCQIVFCASAPDTPEIDREMNARIRALSESRPGIFWIRDMLDTSEKINLYSHAAVFCCPSIYEPFGIINLEAMACEKAVVASAVGGIKEVIVDGKTGFLVPVAQSKKDASYEPLNPAKFARDLAEKINLLLKDEKLRLKMGREGRRRAAEVFSWSAIARKTHALYQTLVKKK